MPTLFLLICLVAAMGMLPCLVLVLIQMFKRGQTGLGVLCIALFCCGWGEIIAFVYGWIKAKQWNIQKIMLAWTVCWAVSIVAWLMWVATEAATGAATPSTALPVSQERVEADTEEAERARQDASARLLDAGVAAVSAYLAKSKEARTIAGGHCDNATVFRGKVTNKGGDQLGQFAVVARRLDASGEYRGFRFGLEDESSRVNINALLAIDGLAENAGRHALLGLPGMTEDVADAILDWIDDDDEPREFGAEADYYSILPRPLQPRNSPLQSIEELLSVRDVTPELLYGVDTNRNGFVDGDEAWGEEVSREDAGSDLGWSAYLTVIPGDCLIPGRINICEAPRAVLAGIPGLDEDRINAILRRGATPEVALDEMKGLEPYVNTRGEVFRARIVAYPSENGPYACREIIVDASRSPPEVIASSNLPSVLPEPELRAMLGLQPDGLSGVRKGVAPSLRNEATRRLQPDGSSRAGTGVETPPHDEVKLRRVELAKAISSWVGREANWLDELRNVSVQFPVARDALVVRMTMGPSQSGGGRIDMDGLIRDPRVLVEMEERLRKSYGRVQGRLQQDRQHQELGYSWPFKVTVVVPPPAIEQPAPDNIPQVLSQLAKYESRSLPGNAEFARSLYQAWLSELIEQVRMLNPSVQSAEVVARRQLYHTLSFSVRARGTLEQLKDFLFAFYRSDLLHQIRSLSIVPVSKEGQLEVTIAIEALMLEQVATGTSDGDEQAMIEEFHRRSSRVSDRLEFQRLEDYELIVRRNLFDAAGNDEPEATEQEPL